VRVHFIPNLKVGVFVTLCAPEVIKTSANPSTPTIGHAKCGHIFNFVDGEVPKRYSSKKELKSLAVKFAEKNRLDSELMGEFLLEVDRLKSGGRMTDVEILMEASKSFIKVGQSFVRRPQMSEE
jgi:hypothetical protein